MTASRPPRYLLTICHSTLTAWERKYWGFFLKQKKKTEIWKLGGGDAEFFLIRNDDCQHTSESSQMSNLASIQKYIIFSEADDVTYKISKTLISIYVLAFVKTKKCIYPLGFDHYDSSVAATWPVFADVHIDKLNF